MTPRKSAVPNAQEWVTTIILGFAFGIVFFDRNAMNFLIPFIIREVSLSNTQIGMIASALAVAWCISGFLVGRWSDRSGRQKPLLIASVLIFSVASSATGLAGGFVTILSVRLLMGLAEGPVLPLAQSLMAKASSPERRGANMGIMQNVFSNLMGSLLAPLVLVAMAASFGWRSAFYLTAIPGLLAAFLIWRYVQEEPVSNKRITSSEPQAATLHQGRDIKRNVTLCIVISALMVGWMITGWVFLPVYFTQIKALSAMGMSILMSLLGVSGAVAGFVIPYLSDRLGRRPVLVAGCLLGVVTPLVALYASTSGWMMMAALATGWMAGGTFSLFMATIPFESVGPKTLTTAMALPMGIGELLGGGLCPAVGGALADHFGLAAPLCLQIGAALLAGLVSMAIVETAPARLNARPTGDPVLIREPHP